VLHHQIGPAAHDRRALLGEHPAPARQRALRGLDGAARLRRAHARHLGHDLARGRVEHGEGGAGVGVDPAAVDVPLAQDEVALQRHDPRAALISAQLATFATFVIA
jgi:hypothetical protein